MTYEEALKQLGKEALSNAIRKEALGHIKKYGLTPDDVEEVTSTISREIDAYEGTKVAA